ncbi:SH3 domain-containing protein [Helicobacter sp. 23-1045]
MDDGSLEKIVYFKILDKNFAFPQLEVIVQNAESSDVSISKEMRGTAIDLRPNHPNFSGVVAENLKVTPNVREYDAKNNIILLEFSAEMANLEDFKIPHLKKQGFESFEGIITRSNGLFYVVLSNQIAALDFEYFDLKSQSYKQEHIKNIATSTSVSINQEIAPINKVLIFKNIVILGLSFVLFVAFLIRKIPFKIRVSLLVVGVLLLLFVVISVNINEKSSMKNDSYLRILPTTNSTIIAKIPANAEVQIISRHNDYIKILTKDNKTGWVEKASVK